MAELRYLVELKNYDLDKCTRREQQYFKLDAVAITYAQEQDRLYGWDSINIIDTLHPDAIIEWWSN